VVWIETELNAPFEHINISNSNNCMYFLAHFTLHQLTVHDFRMSLVNLNSKWPAARAIHKGARLIFVCDKHIPGSNTTSLCADCARGEKISSNSLFAFYYAFSSSLSHLLFYSLSVLLAAFPGISQTQSECSRQRANKSYGNTPHCCWQQIPLEQVLLRCHCNHKKLAPLPRVHNCAQRAPDTCNERKRTEILLLLTFDTTRREKNINMSTIKLNL
jgi:hypothetical protein